MSGRSPASIPSVSLRRARRWRSAATSVSCCPRHLHEHAREDRVLDILPSGIDHRADHLFERCRLELGRRFSTVGAGYQRKLRRIKAPNVGNAALAPHADRVGVILSNCDGEFQLAGLETADEVAQQLGRNGRRPLLVDRRRNPADNAHLLIRREKPQPPALRRDTDVGENGPGGSTGDGAVHDAQTPMEVLL